MYLKGCLVVWDVICVCSFEELLNVLLYCLYWKGLDGGEGYVCICKVICWVNVLWYCWYFYEVNLFMVCWWFCIILFLELFVLFIELLFFVNDCFLVRLFLIDFCFCFRELVGINGGRFLWFVGEIFGFEIYLFKCLNLVLCCFLFIL